MRRLLSKRILLASLILLAVTSAVFILRENFTTKKENSKLNEERIIQYISPSGQSEITEVPFDKLSEDDLGVYYNNSENRVIFHGHQIQNLFFSPLRDKVGFLDSEGANDENVPYERQTLIYIGDVNSRNFKEIYHGSFRTSGWEWLNNDELIVYYNCGTECQSLHLINIDSGEENSLVYGVDYEWSPNKKLVLAYHYHSWGIYGIIVGNKKGKKLLSVTRDNTVGDWSLIDKTKAVWSPDSSRLALIIKKENKNQMELLVFDAANNFKQIFRRDIDESDEYNSEWEENSNVIKLNNVEVRM